MSPFSKWPQEYCKKEAQNLSQCSVHLNLLSVAKFCPVVPEICRGQVHVPKKERRKRIIIRNGAKTISLSNNFQDVCHFLNGYQYTA
jgi:hypothetical protein